MSDIARPRVLSVLDSKRFLLKIPKISDFISSPTPRSNQINIGLKCLPPVIGLREAIITMDDSRISRDGLEKLQALSVTVENNPGRFCSIISEGHS